MSELEAGIGCSPSPEEDSSETWELVRRSVAGSNSALEALYLRIVPAILAWVSLRVAGGTRIRRRLDPEDLVQEVWWRAMRRFGDYDENKGSFRSWVFGITRKCTLEFLRKHYREAELQTDGAFDPDQVPASITSVSGRIARDAAFRNFIDWARSLTDDERRMLIGRLEGLAHGDLARILGISEDAAKKRWVRLLASLAGHRPVGEALFFESWRSGT